MRFMRVLQIFEKDKKRKQRTGRVLSKLKIVLHKISMLLKTFI